MILLICGEETYFSSKKISQIKEKFLSDNKEMGIIVEYSYDNFDVNDFSNKVLAVAFFEERKMFILSNFLSDKSKNNKDNDKLLEILDKAPESSLIVFWEKNSKSNNKLFKEIEKRSKKIWNFEKLHNIKINNWVKSEIKLRGSDINKAALEKLISYSDNDLWQLDQEIEKLTLYKNGKQITEIDIKKIVSSNIQTNIFNFIDSIGRKDKKNALLELNKLLSKGEEPVYILKMLIYQIKNMLIIKDLSEKNMNKKEISEITKKHPYVIEKTLNQLTNFSLKELRYLYDEVFNLEITIKRGGQKPDNALAFFAEKVC
jgi:DNA polymerase-3 subunit delta